MKIQSILFLLVVLLCTSCSPKLQVVPTEISDTINYTLSPKYDGDNYSLLVEINFQADNSDSTILYAPGDWLSLIHI